MNELAQWERYVERFDLSDPKIRLKHHHSLRVRELCGEIARRLSLSPDEIALAKRIGLLHDIGRFPQAQHYGTFLDKDSVSHAALGIEVLFAQGWITRFEKDRSHDALIAAAIAFHSDYALPQGLSTQTRQYCHILRDSDKIDILRVHQEHSYQEFLDCTKEQLAAATISDAILEAFLRHEPVDFSKRQTLLDILLSHDAIVFGLHYPQSRALFIEKGYPLLSALCDIPFAPAARDRLKRIEQECRRCGFPVKEVA